MGTETDSFGYVRIITAKDTETLERAINDATEGKKFETRGFVANSTDSSYSCIIYFYGEKLSKDDLGQNLSSQARWEIDRRSVLELVRLHGLKTAADQFGFEQAELKKQYNLE